MITLDRNYWLESDSYNWVLRYKNVRKENVDGQEKLVTTEDSWYHGELRHALANYVSRAAKVSKGMEDLYHKVQQLHETVNSIKVYFDTNKKYRPGSESINLTDSSVGIGDTAINLLKNTLHPVSNRDEMPLPEDLEDLL